MNPERDIAPPERRADGTFKYPVQVVIQSTGKWQTGRARLETVAYACDLEHVTKLTRCLL